MIIYCKVAKSAKIDYELWKMSFPLRLCVFVVNLVF